MAQKWTVPAHSRNRSEGPWLHPTASCSGSRVVGTCPASRREPQGGESLLKACPRWVRQGSGSPSKRGRRFSGRWHSTCFEGRRPKGLPGKGPDDRASAGRIREANCLPPGGVGAGDACLLLTRPGDSCQPPPGTPAGVVLWGVAAGREGRPRAGAPLLLPCQQKGFARGTAGPPAQAGACGARQVCLSRPHLRDHGPPQHLPGRDGLAAHRGPHARRPAAPRGRRHCDRRSIHPLTAVATPPLRLGLLAAS
jgi:hypothetical protein